VNILNKKFFISFIVSFKKTLQLRSIVKTSKKEIFVISLISCLFVSSVLFTGCLNDDNKSSDNDNNEINYSCEINLTRDILSESLALGTHFLLNNQKAEGNFNYEYDWINQEMNTEDSEVRQAGALWGLSLLYQNSPDEDVLAAIEKGFDFFDENSKESTDGKKWVVYPTSTSGRTGTVALVSLAIIDFLRAAEDIDPEFQDELETDLDKYLTFLVSLRTDNGQFHQSYDHYVGIGYSDPSPYFDGESLLALSKAAKYLDKTEYVSIILESADAMYTNNVVEALDIHPDSTTTKGFFQWGCMSFFEIYTSGWDNTEQYSDIVIELADWMIDVHRTLSRTRNTAYAYEGIIHAYELARQSNDENHIDKFACVIDEGLYKLTSWQVGSPIENEFLQNNPTTDTLAIGGVMNHKEEAPLRIDVAQHQMHAVILALKYVYTS